MIYTWCRKRNSDIIFLQETHSTKEVEIQWKNEWGAKIYMSHGSSNSRGVAVLMKKGVGVTVHFEIIDPQGRFIVLKVEFNDNIYVLINVYAPNKDKDIVTFLEALRTTLQIENLDAEENLIVGGDFNCPINPILDKKGGSLLPGKSVVASISCFQEDLDLVDIWRTKNPVTRSFTWSQNSPNIFCRLDYWLISNNLQDLVISTSIIPTIKTDHSAVFVEFGTRDGQMKGSGLWKMNCSILDDEDYIQDITLKIPAWIADGEKASSDNRIIWEWIKYNIRVHAIQYSKRRVKERSELESVLQNDYTIASEKYESDSSDSNANQVAVAKEKLELFYEQKTKGIIIRARARWHEHGERGTKYFLNLEKRNYVKKHMRKLDIHDSTITDPFTILSEQKRFYQDLYSSGNNRTANNNAKSFLSNLNIPKLTEEQKQACEGKILLEECELIFEMFSSNKAPGNDGIPIEFYRKLWPLISEPFTKCVNECFEKGEMSSSQKQAVITLVEKKGKDRTLLENWRPISLVNVDAKIMSKVIASRIKKCFTQYRSLQSNRFH